LVAVFSDDTCQAFGGFDFSYNALLVFADVPATVLSFAKRFLGDAPSVVLLRVFLQLHAVHAVDRCGFFVLRQLVDVVASAVRVINQFQPAIVYFNFVVTILCTLACHLSFKFVATPFS